MRKTVTLLIILSMLCAIALACSGCKHDSGAEIYKPSKFTETLDLENDFSLFFVDDFEGELNRDIWGDTRQGTRREGFWTKNLAYTDGKGNLIIRTEKRGSRWCSETYERQVVGYNGSTIKVKYDDCNPFGMIVGDFGELEHMTSHTSDMVGNMILSTFDSLGESFSAFMEKSEIPTNGTAYAPTLTADIVSDYMPYYDTAMELYNYYSFVVATKVVRTSFAQSAVIGANYSYTMTFGSTPFSQSIDCRSVIAKLYGFASESEFVAAAQALADRYGEYRTARANGGNVNAALENGCFTAGNGSYIFPLAIENDSSIVLTYVIVDSDGRVSVWLNDLSAALTATNYSDSYYSGSTVNNEMYCKNILFVTGPEGVYSGAVRTRDLFTHGFGYYEICCKLPSTKGIWHAFWMMCGDVYSEDEGSTDGVEIDVFEYLPARDSVNVALHWDGYNDAHKNAHKRYEKTNLADGEYHTFGTLWDENGYAFYIDGKKVWSTKGGGICKQEGYMKISTEYGPWGDWVGTLDIGDLPVDWVIDYVKVYEKKG